jgi:hypothetical protein
MLDLVERDSDPVMIGKEAVVAVQVGDNMGISYTDGTATDPFNNPGTPSIEQAKYTLAHVHNPVLVAGADIQQSDNNSKAVVKALDLAVENTVDTLRRNLVKDIFSDGAGVICKTATNGTATNTLTLESVAGAFAIERGYLQVGSQIDIGTTSNESSVAASVTVTALDPSTPSITISGSAVTTANTNIVSIANSRSGSTSKHVNGLDVIVSDDAFGGIDPADYPNWGAAAVDSTAAALTLAKLNSLQTAVVRKVGDVGFQKCVVVTSPEQRQKLYELLQSQVMFTGDANLAAGDVTQARYNGQKIIADADVPAGKLYLVNPKDLLLVSAGKPYWQEQFFQGSGRILAPKQGYDAFYGAFTYRLQLGAKKRMGSAVATALS